MAKFILYLIRAVVLVGVIVFMLICLTFVFLICSAWHPGFLILFGLAWWLVHLYKKKTGIFQKAKSRPRVFHILN